MDKKNNNSWQNILMFLLKFLIIILFLTFNVLGLFDSRIALALSSFNIMTALLFIGDWIRKNY